MEELKKKKGRPKKIKEEVKEETVLQEKQILVQEQINDLPFPLNFIRNIYDMFGIK